MKSVFIASFLILGANSIAQRDSIWQKPPEISFSGYVDVFYAYDFDQPTALKRQPYLVNHNRHNEFTVNHLILRANVNHEKYRANLGLHTGIYVQDNYAQESAALRYIYEANVGLSLSKKNKLWLDVGIFESHIGFEVAQSIENQTLTRSLCAELSPYYFGGAKLSYDPNKKWSFKLLVLNGWQRIQRRAGNSLLSFGSQIQNKPNDKWLFNWSTFVGTDTPDEARLMRYFSNFYMQFKANKKWDFTFGWDFGMQDTSTIFGGMNNWTNVTLIAHYQPSIHWKTALRLEHFSDRNAIVLYQDWPFYNKNGLSWNIDYAPNPNLLLRWENRLVRTSPKIFVHYNTFTNNNFVSVISLALKFGK